jgi:polysaccharide export outer membrane protein
MSMTHWTAKRSPMTAGDGTAKRPPTVAGDWTAERSQIVVGDWTAARPLVAVLALVFAFAAPAAAQTNGLGGSRTRLDAPRGEIAPDAAFSQMVQRFVASYKLGPGDELAVRVEGEPDYSLDRVRVSPFGTIYHPLLGDVEVAGLSVEQTTSRLAEQLAEYIIKPKVSVALVEARSARVGVLGDVTQPGILTMERPMTVLDAIAASGGVTDVGSRTDITVLRQMGEGRTRTIEVDLKSVMEGKAGPYENISLQPGDTVIVHGNKKKTLARITSLAGFASFLTFVGR